MACQCGCCDTPAPEGTDALKVPETEVKPEELQQRVAELDQRVKDLETAA